MSKHTPGPWNLETVNTQSGICHKIGPFPSKRDELPPRHACLYADYPSSFCPADQELAANARLIAAAPELLEALEGIEIVEHGDEVWLLLRSDGKEIGAGCVRLDGDFAKAMSIYAEKRKFAIAKARGEA